MQYLTDFQGREIPSTGRTVIINNPSLFSPFSEYAHRLISAADKNSGAAYHFYAFNIAHGSRTKEQNLELGSVVERTIAELTDKGKLIGSHYRNETIAIFCLIQQLIISFFLQIV
ncbi:hypothetical protein HZA96_03305 [Candidatus Woesearchaeota archaeon]|nr:hypothetical protein [Candidatus Woesearchaeota archaeon]